MKLIEKKQRSNSKKKYVGWLEVNYLDINIKIDNGSFKFDIFWKKTYTDLIVPEESYLSLIHI